MPELPEVETVRRGLEPAMAGARITRVDARRPDLRFPFPADFARRLTGARIEHLDRRGKFLTAYLSTQEVLIMHLGMSGRFTVAPGKGAKNSPGLFTHQTGGDPKHDHVFIHLDTSKNGGAIVVYNDPRRFGYMDLVAAAGLDSCAHFKAMGPEPLSNHFSAETLSNALRGKSANIKAALLDQRNVAGLGNIYVCEALFRAGISPKRRAASVAGKRAERLYVAIIDVLKEAIDAGGSTLRDFAGADGALGYFQHRFDVYGREGEPCPTCAAPIRRLSQNGRSTFYCGACQR